MFSHLSEPNSVIFTVAFTPAIPACLTMCFLVHFLEWARGWIVHDCLVTSVTFFECSILKSCFSLTIPTTHIQEIFHKLYCINLNRTILLIFHRIFQSIIHVYSVMYRIFANK